MIDAADFTEFAFHHKLLFWKIDLPAPESPEGELLYAQWRATLEADGCTVADCETASDRLRHVPHHAANHFQRLRELANAARDQRRRREAELGRPNQPKPKDEERIVIPVWRRIMSPRASDSADIRAACIRWAQLPEAERIDRCEAAAAQYPHLATQGLEYVLLGQVIATMADEATAGVS